MTYAEAKAALARPPVFGDREQIEAIRVIEAVTAAVDIYRALGGLCPQCHGDKDRRCLACEDSGVLNWDAIDDDFVNIDPEIRKAAIELLWLERFPVAIQMEGQ